MTLRQLYNHIKSLLDGAGIDSPSSEAAIIMTALCGVDRSGLVLRGGEPCSEQLLARAERICDERKNHRPLQYILGEQEFFGESFCVGEGVLIPRDDTEVLLGRCFDCLDSMINAEGAPRPRVAELCSGSGIIAILIKQKYPRAQVTAFEKSAEACRYLRRNAEKIGVDIDIVEQDIFTAVSAFDDGAFDLVAANPPYIKSAEIASLQPEIAFEPLMALDGGEDGLDFHRGILSCWTPKIARGGCIALELGEGQADCVERLMQDAGFVNITAFPDISGVKRVIKGTMP